MINLFTLLKLFPNDYKALITGQKTTLLYRPYPINQCHVIVPNDSKEFTARYFLQIVNNYPIKDDQSRQKIIQYLNITEADLDVYYEHFEKVNLYTVRVYTFLPGITVQPSTPLGHQPLQNLIAVNQYRPILDDHTFEQLCRNPTQPLNELAQLIPQLSTLALTNPQAEAFISTLQAHQQQKPRPRPPITDWIINQDIIKFGEWSIQEEEESVHAQGTRFENIVRTALNFLGFSVDESHQGGAGGIDFFISKPYPIIGECKSGKNIPKDTPNQLVRLGITHLGTDWLAKAVKLIIASGTPTRNVTEFAQQADTCIMNHHTLQKLVSLHAEYPNAINLWELKKYLVADNAEEKIDQYLQQVRQSIAIRAFIVKLVKYLQSRSCKNYISLEAIEAGYSLYQQPPLNRSELLAILIELSSPLTGYLGRYLNSQPKCYYFYYLHDLPTPEEFKLELSFEEIV
ncbi:MAG: hypothetical protein VKJ02_06480 [Snowella sp.]|nr:hypothetical protein [Snowella sp.]